MDVRTTLAFTRPRELARLYRFVVVVWTVSSPTAVAGGFAGLLRVPGAPTHNDVDRGE
nr:MAG TPA: hypothetical protein [Caudoviricetes sp.]